MNEESNEYQQQVRSPRFTHWCAFLVFSTITMVAAIQERNTADVVHPAHGYSIFCSAATFAISLAIVILHLFSLSALFVVGTIVEGGVCLILVILWCVVVGVVSDSKNELAVSEDGTVANGNLYYFSWAGFICSVTLLVSYLRSIYGVDVAGEIKSRSARLNYWSALLCTSLVVLGSSTNTYTNDCITQSESLSFCKKTKFAISIGVIAAFLSLYCVAAKIATSRAPFLLEVAFSVLTFILYVFGVIFLTSADSPGASIGNLYYFTWLSFMISLGLIASCYDDYQAAKNINEHNQHGDNTSNRMPDIEIPDDIPVETIDIDDDQI